MFGDMGNGTRKGWTKQDAEDAARLLQGMAQRGKKAVEAVSSTQIHIDGDVPSGPVENAAGRLEGLQRPAAVIANAGGGSVGGSVLKAGNDNQFGLLDSSMKAARSPSNPSGTPVTSLRALVHPQR
jgi:hypothetical protein